MANEQGNEHLSRHSFLKICLVCLLVSSSVLSAYVLYDFRRYYRDGDRINQHARSAKIRDILWQPPLKYADNINSEIDDYDPFVSADGQTLLLVRRKPGDNADILVAHWDQDAWTAATPVIGINSEYDELGPQLSRDGARLYFYSDRPGGFGGYDLWVSHKIDDQWQEPLNLGQQVNSRFDEYGPALDPKDRQLYFTSNRPSEDDESTDETGEWQATVRERRVRPDHDLYVSVASGSEWQQAVAIVSLNTPFDEGTPAISPVGDFIYFCSDRPGGYGGFDLFRSRIRDGVHQPATNLGQPINNASNQLDPAIGLGGFALYFSSNHDIEPQRIDESQDYDVFYSVSREVFSERDFSGLDVYMMGLLSDLWPYLLGLLLALLLLYLLWRLMHGGYYRKLSLLAKCLLASLIAHLIALLLFSIWQVKTMIEGGRSSRSHKVALISGRENDAIANQIVGLTLSSEQPEFAEASNIEQLKWTLTTPQELSYESTIDPHQSQRYASNTNAVSDVGRLEEIRPDSAVPEQRASGSQVRVPESQRMAMMQDNQVQPVAVSSSIGRLDLQQNATEINGVDVTSPMQARSDLASSLEAIADSSLSQTTYGVSVPTLNSSSKMVVQNPAAHAMPSVAEAELNVPIQAEAIKRRDVVSETIAAPSFVDPTLMLSGTSSTLNGPAVSLDPGEAGVSSVSFTTAAASLPKNELDVAIPGANKLPATGEDNEREVEPGFVQPSPIPVAVGSVELTPGRVETIDVASSAALPQIDRAVVVVDDLRTSDDVTIGAFGSIALPQERALDIRMPEFTAESNPLAQRSRSKRNELLEKMGGSQATELAVSRALDWLARHQSEDGRWASQSFDSDCRSCGGAARIKADVALTGLSLLAFLGADHTHDKDGPYRGNVQRALDWLVLRQRSNGDLRAGETMYSHGIATIALSEALAMTSESKLELTVQKAVQFIDRAKHKRQGGWRYEPRQVGDTSVLGWQVMALKSATTAGVEVPQSAFDSAKRWLVRVNNKRRPGVYCYQPGQPYTPTMTAEAYFVVQLLGDTDPASSANATEYIMSNLPDWESDPNTYYWYYATLALFHRQGQAWQDWNRLLTDELLEHQHQDGSIAGSWDPIDQWSGLAGRVYQTAICTLMLEVYYRYLPLYSQVPVEQTNSTTPGPGS